MTGQLLWTVIGALVAIVGALAIARGARRTGPKP
jgi:hypothetical protein